MLINYLDFRMIVDVQKRHGDLPTELKHHELVLWDLLFDAATTLDLVESVTPGWRRHERREPKLRHGHHIFLASEQARIDAAVANSQAKEPVVSAMATLASLSSVTPHSLRPTSPALLFQSLPLLGLVVRRLLPRPQQ